MSIEASATFTVMEPETMSRMFSGEAGMSAISSVMMQLCNSGGHVVASSKLYGGTHALLSHFLPRKTNVLYFESISNPTLTVANIPELSRIAHDKGVKVVVDNTFAPMVLSPARLGADVVVHSVTKFISGAADIVAGEYV
ncbi:Methionine gamma-lyase [Linum perenne]